MARVQNIDNLFKLVIFHLLTRLLAAHVVGQEVFRFRTGFASRKIRDGSAVDNPRDGLQRNAG